jgi:hypothetical protein
MVASFHQKLAVVMGFQRDGTEKLDLLVPPVPPSQGHQLPVIETQTVEAAEFDLLKFRFSPYLVHLVAPAFHFFLRKTCGFFQH